MADTSAERTGAGMVLLGFAVLFVVVVWIAFRFLVAVKLNRLADVCREIVSELRQSRSLSSPQTLPPRVLVGVATVPGTFHYATEDNVKQ